MHSLSCAFVQRVLFSFWCCLQNAFHRICQPMAHSFSQNFPPIFSTRRGFVFRSFITCPMDCAFRCHFFLDIRLVACWFEFILFLHQLHSWNSPIKTRLIPISDMANRGYVDVPRSAPASLGGQICYGAAGPSAIKWNNNENTMDVHKVRHITRFSICSQRQTKAHGRSLEATWEGELLKLCFHCPNGWGQSHVVHVS